MTDQMEKSTVIEYVQARLIQLGWYDGGPVDGCMGEKLKDEIVAFRRRENIPLTAESGEPLFIDDELMDVLRRAKPKVRPIEQVTATVETIAPKVEAVAENNKSIRSAWWSRLVAFITGIPAGLIGILGLILQQTDAAMAIVTPLRTAFADVPWFYWFLGMCVVCTVLGLQAHFAKLQSDSTEKKLVEKYQEGTMRNDPPSAGPPL